MNHKLLSSLTASLLVATLGVPLASNADPSASSSKDGLQPDLKKGDLKSSSGNAPGLTPDLSTSELKSSKTDTLSSEAVKVGEQPSQANPESVNEIVAKVQSHRVGARQAATLYVRNIPVLTFLGSAKTNSSDVKVGTQLIQTGNQAPSSAKSLEAESLSNANSVSTLLSPAQSLIDSPSAFFNSTSLLDSGSPDDSPVSRATAIAAKINQMHRNGTDASKITVTWDSKAKSSTGDRYLIKTDTTILAVIDGQTLLPDSTRNLEKDALHATNRLRRLLGDATPLREVAGKPARRQEIAFGSFSIRLTGMASWYGPGLHGNPCASGETFNQNAMTAAHRTLPFGTRVLVTNLDNGQSVVVRINDRGPFHSSRIIDLSTAAARVIGVVQTGVAPVRLDVIDPRSASAAGN